ncbi:hypothetical protein [uncultured Imperialibacter sp.]|uniref:hypothetical protein n=1 Tax=uncultured Imperialibacter sp. TaxID=1672639 RepID=UPI0030DA43E0|tara:strand:+ start:208123 stop:208527 length:405 start_codon:yes stop_codon:yes gene_type:complete
MYKSKQLLIQLPVNGNLSSTNVVRDGILEAINVITCYDNLDQKVGFRSVNALNSVVKALSTTPDNSSEILLPSFDNDEMKESLYQWLHDAIDLISGEPSMDDPEGSRRAIAAISTVLRGMHPFLIQSEFYLRSA